MRQTIDALQKKRDKLLNELHNIEEFRRGTISVNYRKCGKSQCWCSREGAKGHGPQYLWSATIGGKSVAKSLKLGVELEKYIKETDGYKRFTTICQELVSVNEQLCEARPMRQEKSEDELETLKKKLLKQLQKKRVGK